LTFTLKTDCPFTDEIEITTGGTVSGQDLLASPEMGWLKILGDSFEVRIAEMVKGRMASHKIYRFHRLSLPDLSRGV
jgi:hypothetical protein